ncbi:ABC transporter ATP-binding protein [Cytobacillus sp. S13-E01]|uniref:ABC transporter ATP-binding protein n=1 Tax=Cytobacillus sp. S13-E01 TaxID=3031326 RepID=UPI0023D89494|nr:ABC transporter ATP-binding protein [Cytobacillus sp. S13-E01]MDF0726006.1 ABC transporter ATP-binding protein [Cytobacillus sp. S13-E01]
MGNDCLIKLNHVGKHYSKSASSLFDIKNKLLNRQKAEGYWSLRDISLTIQKGETVAILGGNGSGKSTLLKVILGVTAPTEGSVEVRGRIGGLIELGAGFHKEMTGRENIYINGVVLGLKEKEIDALMDDIIAFAELEGYIDSPIKHYSSGMKVRLGFAIAIHVDSDIILLEEVLAVGDARFRKKAMNAIETYLQNKTIIFVSHSNQQVREICKKAIVLCVPSFRLTSEAHMYTGQYT